MRRCSLALVKLRSRLFTPATLGNRDSVWTIERVTHEGGCSAYTCGFALSACPETDPSTTASLYSEADFMSNCPFNVTAGAAFLRIAAHSLLVVSCFAGSTFSADALSAVPAEFRGTWVPSKATCESPVRVLVAADRLTLVNGKDSEGLGGIEMAGPGFFPPDYRGIMAVLITEFSGHQPVTVIFNLKEKRGVAQIEFAPVQPGATNAQGKLYNAHISKLNLARRFALDKALLKKCAGGTAATPSPQVAQPAVVVKFAVGDAVEARYGRDWIPGRVNSIRESGNAQSPEAVYEVLLENGKRGMLPASMIRKAAR
jgi:hypothetical protein